MLSLKKFNDLALQRSPRPESANGEGSLGLYISGPSDRGSLASNLHKWGHLVQLTLIYPTNCEVMQVMHTILAPQIPIRCIYVFARRAIIFPKKYNWSLSALSYSRPNFIFMMLCYGLNWSSSPRH